MSIAELKERHVAATETVNALRERLKQKRLHLLDTDGNWTFCIYSRGDFFKFFLCSLFLDLPCLL